MFTYIHLFNLSYSLTSCDNSVTMADLELTLCEPAGDIASFTQILKIRIRIILDTPLPERFQAYELISPNISEVYGDMKKFQKTNRLIF